MRALGYERVDDDPNVSVLLETMGATGRWEATLRLRAWEREQLNLTPGQRLSAGGRWSRTRVPGLYLRQNKVAASTISEMLEHPHQVAEPTARITKRLQPTLTDRSIKGVGS